ncbi:MAG: WecB/TagA/CpsF family glycosyltransferase, partial [Melioribacteraceae bacterium]|nr:WecB/TagA/CpsF family glycosyltransferase [Melioribacteraceae bacterium]
MKIPFFDTFVNIKNYRDYKEAILNSAIDNQSPKVIYYLNSHTFYEINTDPVFKRCFNSADYIVPDGQSIIWGMKIISNISIIKIGFAHFFRDILGDFLSEKKFSTYMLGSTEDGISNSVKKIKNNFPKLIISGFSDGYFDDDFSQNLIDDINKSDSHILIVGMGIPKSEFWINKYKDLLEVKCIISAG